MSVCVYGWVYGARLFFAHATTAATKSRTTNECRTAVARTVSSRRPAAVVRRTVVRVRANTATTVAAAADGDRGDGDGDGIDDDDDDNGRSAARPMFVGRRRKTVGQPAARPVTTRCAPRSDNNTHITRPPSLPPRLLARGCHRTTADR